MIFKQDSEQALWYRTEWNAKAIEELQGALSGVQSSVTQTIELDMKRNVEAVRGVIREELADTKADISALKNDVIVLKTREGIWAWIAGGIAVPVVMAALKVLFAINTVQVASPVLPKAMVMMQDSAPR